MEWYHIIISVVTALVSAISALGIAVKVLARREVDYKKLPQKDLIEKAYGKVSQIHEAWQPLGIKTIHFEKVAGDVKDILENTCESKRAIKDMAKALDSVVGMLEQIVKG